MYEEIQCKLDDSNGWIERVTHLGLETVRTYKTELVSSFVMDFLKDTAPEEIADIFDIKESDEIYPFIKDNFVFIDCTQEEALESLGFIVQRANKPGFLAEVRTPLHLNFEFEEGELEYSSCKVNTRIQQLTWVYADTLDELVEKSSVVSKVRVQEMIKAEKHNNGEL